MSASQSGTFNVQEFTDLGVPLVGGRLYTYAYGTTTQKTAYTDHAGTIPHTYTSDGLGGQYIALNSRGELPAALYLSGGSYDLALKTAAGATVWTRRADPVFDIANDLSTSSGASLVGYLPAGTGAVATTVQGKLRESVSVKDFGAVGDGVTDDSAAINAAINYLSGLSYTQNSQVTLNFPNGKYRIANSIVPKSNVRLVGYGVTLVGPITGYERITALTPIPTASDVAGQTGGGCFSDASPMTNLASPTVCLSPVFEGFTLSGFRYGFLSRGGVSWYNPTLRNITWQYCDICCFAYYGAQDWTIENPSSGSCNAFFVGSATAFTSGHPCSSGSNDAYFCDGLHIHGYQRGDIEAVASSTIDAWFYNAILRPASLSVTAGGSKLFQLSGKTPAALSTTFEAVTGRVVYIPQRNARGTLFLNVENIVALNCARGYIAVSDPINANIKSIGGELVFNDGTINASNTECGIVIGVQSGTVLYANIANVDCYNVTGTHYDSVVGVISSGNFPITSFNLSEISGRLNTAYYTWFSAVMSANDTYSAYEVHRNTATLLSQSVAAANAGTFTMQVYSYPYRTLEPTVGTGLLTKVVTGEFPGPAGTETALLIANPAGGSFRSASEAVQGILTILVRRKDTGVQEFGQYLVTWGNAYSTSTLSAGVSSGISTLPINSASGFGPGSVILVNGLDRYIVKTATTTLLTLTTPTRNAYISTNTVSAINSFDTTVRAQTILGLGFNGWNIQLTNTLGSGVPVEFRLTFEYFGAPA